MRAYSKQQFYDSGFNSEEYTYADFEGTFNATLDCKRWGNGSNVLGFFTLENGRKIISAAWQRENYLGIPEMEIGTKVILTYKKAFNGKCYLNKVERR